MPTLTCVTEKEQQREIKKQRGRISSVGVGLAQCFFTAERKVAGSLPGSGTILRVSK